MAKRKSFKLQKTQKTYSPIVAIMGGKHHTDYMLKDYGSELNFPQEKVRIKTKVASRRRIKRSIFTKNRSEERI